MADEPNPDLEEAPDPNVAPEQGAADDTPDPIANLASEMGWVPQDQFRGDPNEWKPAADFIKAGRDINRGLSKELRGMRDQVERIGRTTSQLIEDKVAERDAHWQRVHANAVEKGDNDAAARAVDELVKIRAADKPVQPGEPQETADFKARNAGWFGKDDLATVRAMEVAQQVQAMGKGIPEQLQAAERAVRREFPELFKAPSKTPAATQTAGSRTATTGSRARGFADMPPESQKMARDFERKHGMKVEKFAASYWADQDKLNRRVG